MTKTIKKRKINFENIFPNQLDANLILKKRIGGGWSSNVYEARLRREQYGLKAGAKVAVKIYKPHIFEQCQKPQNILKRIKREFSSATKIADPCIVRGLALGNISPNGQPLPAIVMEFVSGKTLAEFIKKSFPIESSKLYHITKNLLQTVHILHSKYHFVHRDIKPENIKFRNNFMPVILDLGVIKLRLSVPYSITSSSDFLGTTRYASPSHLFSGASDPSVDIWSLGTVLYQLFYGRMVYNEVKRKSNLILAISKGPPPIPVGNNRFGCTPKSIHFTLERVIKGFLCSSEEQTSIEEGLVLLFICQEEAKKNQNNH